MVKPREHRIHMYLSEEELQTIEDWRYANRIATRSDAIRRLCHIGLAAEENARQIGKVAAAAMMWASKTRKLQSEELDEQDPNRDGRTPAPASHQANLFTTMALLGTITLARRMEEHARNLSSPETFETALAKALAESPEVTAATEMMEEFTADLFEKFPELADAPADVEDENSKISIDIVSMGKIDELKNKKP